MRLAGCDYVSGPSAAELRAAGKRFACRYLSTPGNPKNLTAAERASLEAAGLAVVLVFETTANRTLEGAAAGAADATAASAQAASLGLARAPLFFAVDFDPSPAQLKPVLAYFAAAGKAVGHRRVGAYGGGRALAAIRKAGLARFYWQAAASAWGPPLPGRQLQQGPEETIGGHKVDTDTALERNYGQTPPPPLRWRWIDGLHVRAGSPLWLFLARHRASLGRWLRHR